MDYTQIEPTKSKKIAKLLDELLAGYQVYCQKLKAYHWNVKGEKIFELHAQFEVLYRDTLMKIDEIAERILTLGYAPTTSFKNYLVISPIKEVTEIPIEREMINNMLLDMNQLLKMEKACLKIASESNDSGTVEMLNRYIAYKEKVSWKFFTWLKI